MKTASLDRAKSCLPTALLADAVVRRKEEKGFLKRQKLVQDTKGWRWVSPPGRGRSRPGHLFQTQASKLRRRQAPAAAARVLLSPTFSSPPSCAGRARPLPGIHQSASGAAPVAQGALVRSQLAPRPEAAPRPPPSRMKAARQLARLAQRWGLGGRAGWSGARALPARPPQRVRVRLRSASVPGAGEVAGAGERRGQGRGSEAGGRGGAGPDKRQRGGPTPLQAAGQARRVLSVRPAPAAGRRRARPAARPWRLSPGRPARPAAAASPRPWRSCPAPAT